MPRTNFRTRRLLAVSFLLAAPTVACAHDPAAEMATAAERFLQALDAQQREKAVFELSADERQNWHFVPDRAIRPGGTRRGLTLKQMSAHQRALAHSLVAAGLSHKGYLTAMTITSLEQVLHDLENQSPMRDPELYYLTIFGEPGPENSWGWRFEGHHLSVNVTIVEGRLFSVTPTFFGSNPAVVKQGPRRGLWTLADEEQLGRRLVRSLSAEQRQAAILTDEAPRDIITGDQRAVDRGVFTPPKGIAADDLTAEQRQVLRQLVRAYAEKFRPEIVDQVAERSGLFDMSEMHFAWAGGLEPGEGHYYRVQAPKFLIEYDNTQNNANHVHAVWRDFDGDFGVDLLRQHYQEEH